MNNYIWQKTVSYIDGRPITGFVDEADALQFNRLNDSANHMMDLDGAMSVYVNSDRSGEVILKLKHTAPINGYLSAKTAAQENGLFTPVFFTFKDTLGGDIINGTNGYYTRPANTQRGSGIQVQEWRIVVERLDQIHKEWDLGL